MLPPACSIGRWLRAGVTPADLPVAVCRYRAQTGNSPTLPETMNRPDRLTIIDCAIISACAVFRAQADPSRSAGEYQTVQTMLALGADTVGRVMRAGAVL